MITIEHRDRIVKVSVFGEFSLADYKQLEESVVYELTFQGKVNLLFDLRDRWTSPSTWLGRKVRFNWRHAHDFKRIAVVAEERQARGLERLAGAGLRRRRNPDFRQLRVGRRLGLGGGLTTLG